MRAAERIGPAARPLPLFYALSQAGRAIARIDDDQWRLSGHGLSVQDSTAATDVMRWNADPGMQANRLMFGTDIIVRGLPSGANAEQITVELGHHPAAAGAGIRIEPHLGTPGTQDEVVTEMTPEGRDCPRVTWRGPRKNHPPLDRVAPEYRGTGIRCLMPTLPTGDLLTPLMLWWVLLLGLSSVARPGSRPRPGAASRSRGRPRASSAPDFSGLQAGSWPSHGFVGRGDRQRARRLQAPAPGPSVLARVRSQAASGSGGSPGAFQSAARTGDLRRVATSIAGSRYAQVRFVAGPAFATLALDVGLTAPQLIVGERVIADQLPVHARVIESVDEKSVA